MHKAETTWYINLVCGTNFNSVELGKPFLVSHSCGEE